MDNDNIIAFLVESNEASITHTESLLQKYKHVLVGAFEHTYFIIDQPDEYIIDILKLNDFEIVDIYHISKILINNIPVWINDTDNIELYERIISKHEYHSYLYATEVLGNKRFIKGEEVIKKSTYACAYAMYVLKDRWIDAEPFIREIAYAKRYDNWINSKRYAIMGKF